MPLLFRTALRTALIATVALGATTAPVAAQAAPAAPAAPDSDALRASVRRHRAANDTAILRELMSLLAIPNLASDSANIRRNARQVVAMLERRGVSARLLESEGSPPAVYGELRVPGAARTVVLYAHYDGQPVDRAQWATDPWTPTLRGDAPVAGGPDERRVYARSASDDKAPIVAMLAALDALRAAGVTPSVNVKFFFDGEEEAGSPHLRAMLERHRDLLAGDAWIFADGPVHQTGRPQVVLGVRGTMGLELTTYGPLRTLHSGHYGNWAPNPVVSLAHLIASMRSEEGDVTIAGFADRVRPTSDTERRALAAVPAVDSALRHSLALGRTEGKGAPLVERIMRPALNLRGVAAGHVGAEAANAIPTEARASIDFRLVPDQTPESVRAAVERHVRAQGFHVTHDSVTPEMRRAHPKVARLEWEDGYPGVRTPIDLPVSRAVLRVVRDATSGSAIALPMLGGSLPMYVFGDVLGAPLLVLPTVNYDNNQHAANENLRLQNLWDGIDVFAALMARLGREWR